MRHPDITKPYIIRCDASKIAVAAILSQLDELGDEMIIDITSRCLSEQEINVV